MNKSICKKYIFLIGSLFILLLSSCHSRYLNIDIKYDGSTAWNKDRSGFVFVARTCLFRRPEGVATFPDGGRVKNEYLDFSLYYFDIKTSKLTHLVSLNEFYRGTDYRWSNIRHISLELKDSLLFYKLPSPSESTINDIKKHVFIFTAKQDSINNLKFMEDVAKTYQYNIVTHQKKVLNTSEHKHLFNRKQENMLRSAPAIKSIMANLSYSDWGIHLKDIYPQSKYTYMEYIIGSYNKNIVDAIYEQIVPVFDQKDKSYILREMNKRKEKLFKIYKKNNDGPYQESLKKSKYENYIKYIEETKKRLNSAN